MPATSFKLNPADNRRAARHKARLKVRFKTPRAFIQEYTVNISKGGIFIQTNLKLDREDPVELIIHLPHTGRDITLQARVAWVLNEEQAKPAGKHAGLGLEIVNLSKDERELFELYIDRITETGSLDE